MLNNKDNRVEQDATKATAAAPGPLTWRRAVVDEFVDELAQKEEYSGRVMESDGSNIFTATITTPFVLKTATFAFRDDARRWVQAAMPGSSLQWKTYYEYHARTPCGREVRVLPCDSAAKCPLTYRAEIDYDPPFPFGRFSCAHEAMDFVDAAFSDSPAWRIDPAAGALHSTHAAETATPTEAPKDAPQDGWIATHNKEGLVNGQSFARGGQVIGFVSASSEHERGMVAAYIERGLGIGDLGDRCLGVYITLERAKAAVERHFATADILPVPLGPSRPPRM